MEKKNSKVIITDTEFSHLLDEARNNNNHAVLKLLSLFEPDILKLSSFIKMPKEDVMQSLKLELISLFKDPNSVKKMYRKHGSKFDCSYIELEKKDVK